MPRSIVAYVVTRAADDRSDYMGAVMATDEKSLPLEFSYTSPPISPTRLQRILFGGALDSYLRRDVIGSQLVKSLKNRPDLLIASDELLLELSGDVQCPVIRVQEGGSRATSDVGDAQKLGAAQYSVQLSDRGGPLRVTLATDDDAQWESVRTALLHLTETMDIIEPLERVTSAIELIWKSESEEHAAG